MKRWLMFAFMLLGLSRLGSSCSDRVTFHNVGCCDGSIFTETLTSGDGTRYDDGQTACAFDSGGNPCYAGRVVSCGSAAVEHPNTAPARARFKPNSYEELVAFVKFCPRNGGVRFSSQLKLVLSRKQLPPRPQWKKVRHFQS